ncbi:MAG: glycosyltransferase family 2 protein [Cyanobacteria bacterium P01_F01_bin.53]
MRSGLHNGLSEITEGKMTVGKMTVGNRAMGKRAVGNRAFDTAVTGASSANASLPSLSVIVPVHNGGESFQRCMRALSESVLVTHCCAATAEIEIIVVADGDSDGSWQLAEEFGTRLIRLPKSKGPAAARNAGAEMATGDLLFFVDADVEVHLETLLQVMASFAQDPELAALIGSYDDAPGDPNFLSQYRNLLHHYTHQVAQLEASTFWGACGAIRRHVFKAVDGFDKTYRRPCIEDIELGYRLKQAGYKIHLRKDIQVKHLKRWTPYSLLRADFFYRALPWTALLLKLQQSHPVQYRRVMSDLNLTLRSRFSVMLVYGLLAAVVIAPWFAASWGVAALLGLALTVLNFSVYDFFRQKHGLLFALKTVPWHWLYFLYSGLAYAIGQCRHRFA